MEKNYDLWAEVEKEAKRLEKEYGFDSKKAEKVALELVTGTAIESNNEIVYPETVFDEGGSGSSVSFIRIKKKVK